MTGRALFDAVVARSGLSDMVAPFTISRLLSRAGCTTDDLTPQRLSAMLGDLEQGLAVYLAEDEVAAAVGRIRPLAAGETPTA